MGGSIGRQSHYGGARVQCLPGVMSGGQGAFIYHRGNVQLTHTQHTQVGGCVLLFCLLLLFPKLSVPAVLILQVICGCLSARVSTWHSFVDTFAGREGCPRTRVFTGGLNVSAQAHHSAVSICPSVLSLRQRDGEHWQGGIDPLCAERN